MDKKSKRKLTYDEMVGIIKDLKRVVDNYNNGGEILEDDPPYKDAVKLLMHYKRKVSSHPDRKRNTGSDYE